MALKGKLQSFTSNQIPSLGSQTVITVNGKGILKAFAFGTAVSVLYPRITIDGVTTFAPTNKADFLGCLGMSDHSSSPEVEHIPMLFTDVKNQWGQIEINLPFKNGFSISVHNEFNNTNDSYYFYGSVLYATEV